ncbi:hypothetical protein NFI96_010677 [Prochilodus magdalenae]|nr:hypothetical protein NFI96_010677 [Prochilodus magdalenae]
MKELFFWCELKMCLPYRRKDDTNMISGTDGTSKHERRRARLPETFHLLSAVVVWLVTGTTISSLNKWIFAVYNFRYPLLLSALHMLTAIVVDYGLIKYWFVRRRGLNERGLTSSAKCKVFLLSLTFCASIAFGNVGLNYVQLSFAQMIYTTTPIFTLAISSLVLGKQHHILKYTAMMPICLGASFSIMGEVQFDQTGCLFVFAATMLRGVKSIQQSILLQEEKIHSVFLLYLMAIPSFCILAVAALVLENWAGLQSPVHYDRHLWGFILLSCLGSVLYNLASCCVISLTSAVTLHILGNLNVVGNLLLSQLLFESQLSALSCAGAALTLSGMIIYQNTEFIAGFLETWRERNTSTREAKPDLGSTSESHLEPLDKSLDLSSEECHSEEPWVELYNDQEPYLDLEPSTDTLPKLFPDVGLSPEASPELYCDLEPCPESSPKLHNDLKPSPELYHNLEMSPELHQDHKNCSRASLETCNGLETSPEVYCEPEISRDVHKDVEKIKNTSSGLYDDLESSLETSPEQHHEPETTSKVHQDLEQCIKASPDRDSSPEMSPELYHKPEPLPGLHHELQPCPEMPQEVLRDLEPCSETSSQVYHDHLEAFLGGYDDLEPTPELKQDLEPCPEPSSKLYDNILETSIAQHYDLQLCPEPTPEVCDDLEIETFPAPPELSPGPLLQNDIWTEKHEKTE